MSRAIINRLETGDYIPSIPQLESIGEILGFELCRCKESKLV